MSPLISIGKADIQNGQRYIKQLCKHWAHHLEVQLDEQGARVVFPKELDDPDYQHDAIALFNATASRLDVHLTAYTPTQLTALCEAIDEHLDRFAHREGGLRLQWKPE